MAVMSCGASATATGYGCMNSVLPLVSSLSAWNVSGVPVWSEFLMEYLCEFDLGSS
jgi:hypothetical protein